jgi:putative oxidoreductase
MIKQLETTWAPRMLSILRIVSAAIFMIHGTQKLFGWPARMGGGGPPPTGSLSWWAGLIEVIGGPLLLLGLLTRPVALILSGEMAFAYWIAHFPRDFYPVNNRGDAAILYCFVFLYIAIAGGGVWSLDRMWRKQR